VILIPAIDLKDGRCVRLVQGDFSRATVYGDDPAAMAEHWVREGAAWLHVVDLDGAASGRLVHLEALRRIAARTAVPIEFGGGVRTLEEARAVFAAGAERLILGTVALEVPERLERLTAEYPGRVYVALDAREGRVATRGWTETTAVTVHEAAHACERRGAAGFLFTDISRDGTGSGVNVASTVALAEAVRRPVIASGGIATLDDVRALRAVEGRGVAAAIIGRALYTGAIRLAEAMAAV
jgi:phosphoribosylformimino-5-aminoimidazole carboxamide ribotide isomerase